MSEQKADKRGISRRKFLKAAGIAIGAGAAACGGASYFALKTPASVEFPELSCGGDGDGRVLVAYASKCGATAEAAEFIGKRLCEKGCAADVLRARNVKDLSAYRALILGSACYMGKLLGEAKSFASKYLGGLSDIPAALFSLGLTVKENTPENIKEALAYFDPLREYVTPQAVGTFPGRIEVDTLPPFYRIAAEGDTEGIMTPGDFRDWDAMAAWVDALPAGFLPV